MKNFKQLISSIEQVHRHLQAKAVNAVNQALTIRNWVIGYYIVEFEQEGKDRAVYGANLLSTIASKITIKGLSAPELSRCRQFYHTYPQILGSLTQKFKNQIPESILGSLTQKSQSLTDQFNSNQIRRSMTPESKKNLQVPPNKIITKLSFTHLVELIKIDDHYLMVEMNKEDGEHRTLKLNV